MKRSQLMQLWITNICGTSSRNSTNRDCSAGRSRAVTYFGFDVLSSDSLTRYLPSSSFNCEQVSPIGGLCIIRASPRVLIPVELPYCPRVVGKPDVIHKRDSGKRQPLYNARPVHVT